MQRNLTIIGCGPAGLIAACTAAQSAPDLQVTVLEREAEPLRWMNNPRQPPALSRAEDSPDSFAAACPRGADFMYGAVQAFPPSQLRQWLAAVGVKTRMDAFGALLPEEGLAAQRLSKTLLHYAESLGVKVHCDVSLSEMTCVSEGFRLWPKSGPSMDADYVLLATGGRSGQTGWNLARQFGHEPSPWAPSPVLLQSRDTRARVSAPLHVEGARAKLADFDLQAAGGVTLQPTGIGGAAVLELTARYAHELAERDYKTLLEINWAADRTQGQPTRLLRQLQQSHARKSVAEDPPLELPQKLWERLVQSVKLPKEARWSALSAAQLQTLAGQIVSSRFKIEKRAMNKAEWVASGGVPLGELDPISLHSLRQEGLYMAGEMIDIDALAGGWNLHCAWTTGWMVASAIAARVQSP